LAILLLATALVLFGTRSHAVLAQGSTDNVQDIDLAKMALPLSAFGSDYAGLEINNQTAFLGPDGKAGQINGYRLAFGSSNANKADLAISVVALVPTATDAGQYIQQFIATAEAEYGDRFATYPVDNLPDGVGIRLILSDNAPDVAVQETGVVFHQGRIGAVAVIIRVGNVDVHAAVGKAASALNDRIKGVLTGKVTDFPAPLPPDVNCNGDVDSIDASLVLQLGAGLVASLPCGALGDANQDGHTNAIDASLILQYSAGLIDQLPVPG
jgi:hypothetical protein